MSIVLRRQKFCDLLVPQLKSLDSSKSWQTWQCSVGNWQSFEQQLGKLINDDKEIISK
jgi:hypothetical protein